MSGGSPPDEDDGGLTEEDYRRIREFAEKDPGDRNPSDLVPDVDPQTNGDTSTTASDETDETGVSRRSSSGVGRSTCKRIRERMEAATTAKELVESYPQRHTSEIMRHAYGECNCGTDYPPKASPQIKPAECREFREYYSDGYSVSEIAETFARSDNSVTRHIFGRCSHGEDPRDLSPSEVEEGECKRLRGTYNRNEKVDRYAVASAMRLRREVASYHLFGLCECEQGEPPADEDRPLDDRRFRPVEPGRGTNH